MCNHCCVARKDSSITWSAIVNRWNIVAFDVSVSFLIFYTPYLIFKFYVPPPWVRWYDCGRVNAWMSVTVEFQQSECFGMSAVAVCHVQTTWSRENVESWMSLWRTWEVYESFTFFISVKEYRSKTNVTRIEKTNTNVACNNCQAKYDDSKCKTTDLLQAMTCIALK